MLGSLMETVTSDGQTGYRAFSARALAAARIAHDYNYAQVLTLSLWGAGIEPVEVPIRYRRRDERPLVRALPGVPRARGAGGLARVARGEGLAQGDRATATPIAPASQNGHPPPGANSGSASVSGPNGASGRLATSEPSPQRTST